MLIFNEVFVEPKQKEIEKIKLQQEENFDLLSNQKTIARVRVEKQELERVKDMKNCDVNHSNMLNQSEHVLKKSSVLGFLKVNTS